MCVGFLPYAKEKRTFSASHTVITREWQCDRSLELVTVVSTFALVSHSRNSLSCPKMRYSEIKYVSYILIEEFNRLLLSHALCNCKFFIFLCYYFDRFQVVYWREKVEEGQLEFMLIIHFEHYILVR